MANDQVVCCEEVQLEILQHYAVESNLGAKGEVRIATDSPQEIQFLTKDINQTCEKD